MVEIQQDKIHEDFKKHLDIENNSRVLFTSLLVQGSLQ